MAASLAKENDLARQFNLATPLLGAGAGGLGPVSSVNAMIGAVHEHLRASSADERETLAKLVFVVLRPEDARVVELGAAKYCFPLERIAP